jgi:hypothetical protein
MAFDENASHSLLLLPTTHTTTEATFASTFENPKVGVVEK